MNWRHHAFPTHFLPEEEEEKGKTEVHALFKAGPPVSDFFGIL